MLVLTVAENPMMAGVFPAHRADAQTAVLAAVRRLADDAGVAAYLVGGPVRDRLLGVPVHDLDVTVAGDAPALAQRLADAIGGQCTVHRRFGTATVETPNIAVDLVSARRETYPTPAALPVVQTGTLADDLARRDFTINAMAQPIAGADDDTGNDGLIDHHGGRADLASGVIRTLHPRSFCDDPTRIFRAVRYEQRFGFRIAADTLNGLQSAVAAGSIGRLSGDRVRHELARILHEPAPLPALQRANALGIWPAVHPSLNAAHLSGLQDWQAPAPAWMSALVWPLSGPAGAAVASRLNAPSDWMRAISDTAILTSRLPALQADNLPPSGVCLELDGLSPDALAAGIALAPAPASARIARYLAEWWQIAPLLRGDDLLAIGVPAGPSVGEVLRVLRQSRLDGQVHSRQDEVQLARQWAVKSE